jgi:hypothetical protein
MRRSSDLNYRQFDAVYSIAHGLLYAWRHQIYTALEHPHGELYLPNWLGAKVGNEDGLEGEETYLVCVLAAGEQVEPGSTINIKP